jgi:pimeloyl-ACP methyl ester carboxylesterase
MKTPILILHGWAKEMSGQKYQKLAKLLQDKGYEVFTPDLPGFGTNPLKKDALVFEEYVAFVKEYIEKKIKSPKVVLFGHSFGGRIAIRFAAQNPAMVEKLILADASGIPQKISPKKQVVVIATKILKPLFTLPFLSLFYPILRKVLYRGIGEMDYYKAGNLTQTFKNVYQVNIVSDLAHVSMPTLIVWGEKDTFTPLGQGKKIHEGIKGSEFAIIPNASHRLPYENPEATAQKVLPFLS